MKKTKVDKGFLALNIVWLLMLIFTFVYWLNNVDAGEWLARENYESEQEWLRNMGMFIGAMAGWCYFLTVPTDWIAQSLDKKRKCKCHG